MSKVSSPARIPSKAARRDAGIHLDALESRQLMSANSMKFGYRDNGVGVDLVINGSKKNDKLYFSQQNGQLYFRNGTNRRSASLENVTRIVINAGDGKDRVSVDASVDIGVSITGGAGNDTLSGGSGDDSIFGGRGKDRCYGNDGDDTFADNDGSSDTYNGGGGFDSFWADRADKLGDALSNEEERVGAYNVITAMVNSRAADPAFSASGRTRMASAASLPIFGDKGPVADDVRQGGIGDCWFLAGLSAIADVDPTLIRSAIADLGDGTFGVRFNYNGATTFVRIDGDLPVDAQNSPLAAKLGQGGSTWVALFEKALACIFTREGGGPANTYSALDGGLPSWGFSLLGAGDVTMTANQDPQAFINYIYDALQSGRAVTLGSISMQHSGAQREGLIPGTEVYSTHAYMVNDFGQDQAGNWYIQIRNPWGKDLREADGTPTDGNSDGYVWVPLTTAAQVFNSASAAIV